MQIVEFLRQQTPERELDREIGRIHRSNMRKARSRFFH
jgi:hypothetical protein